MPGLAFPGTWSRALVTDGHSQGRRVIGWEDPRKTRPWAVLCCVTPDQLLIFHNNNKGSSWDLGEETRNNRQRNSEIKGPQTLNFFREELYLYMFLFPTTNTLPQTLEVICFCSWSQPSSCLHHFFWRRWVKSSLLLIDWRFVKR